MSSLITLHPGQMTVFNNKARFRVVCAGRRWGKTQTARAELLRAASKPKQKVWYVAPSYRMAKQIMWNDLMDILPPEWIKKTNMSELTIRLKNGSIIALKGADNPDSLRGVGLDFIVLDEMQDISEDTWVQVLRPTLATTRGKAIFIGTPKSKNHFYRLWLNGQNDELVQKGRWMSWQFPTIMSPFVPQDEIDQAKADMDERSFKQEFEATFLEVSGRVYHQFDKETHVGDYPFNPSLPIWVGQDFNVDPMSTVIMQPQRNGEVWVVDEIYMSSSNTVEVCNELERRYWRYKHNIIIFPDPAGANRSSGRGESDLDIFRDRGFTRIRYRKKHPPVADRVNSVNKMFRTAEGKVRLKVDKSCNKLIASLEETMYKKNSPEIDKSLNIEHMTDALGYCIELKFPRRAFEPTGVSI